MTGGSYGVLADHSDAGIAVEFTLDGRPVVTASDDETVWPCATPTGESPGVLEYHSSEINARIVAKMVLGSGISGLKFTGDWAQIQTDQGSLTLSCRMDPSNIGQTNVGPLLAINYRSLDHL